jgi:hypothetical protein
MRTCEVIETNRYTFRPNAERDTKSPQAAAAGRLIGYARMSTEDRGTDPQCDGHDMLDRYLADSARPSWLFRSRMDHKFETDPLPPYAASSCAELLREEQATQKLETLLPRRK